MKRFLVASLLLTLSVPLFAHQPLEGTYKLDRGRSDSIDKAIESTIKTMSFVTRPIARSRLRKTNPAFERMTLAFSGDQVRVTAGPGVPVVVPASGKPIQWTREDGEIFTVSGKLQKGTYTETFDAKDGRRINAYSLDPDGRLLLHVTVTAPRLPAPLRYKLVYHRS